MFILQIMQIQMQWLTDGDEVLEVEFRSIVFDERSDMDGWY